jgi:hypothetical protein
MFATSIICTHGPWFAEKYGSLAIWGTQGMEKSHKLAHTIYHRYTQKGGGSNHSDVLVQMGQAFYRRKMVGFKRKHQLPETIELRRVIRQVKLSRKRRRYDVSEGGVGTSARYAICMLTFLPSPFNLFIVFKGSLSLFFVDVTDLLQAIQVSYKCILFQIIM